MGRLRYIIVFCVLVVLWNPSQCDLSDADVKWFCDTKCFPLLTGIYDENTENIGCCNRKCPGWIMKNQHCVPVDYKQPGSCKWWDFIHGYCLQCSNGFIMNSNAECVYDFKQIPSGCQSWNLENKKCLECQKYLFLNANGLCVKVSQLCKSHDGLGACDSCYKGYELIKGECVMSSSKVQPSFDLGCKSWDWDNKKCLQCSKNWVFNQKGICFQVSYLCKSNDIFGNCTTCYQGYDLKQGSCVLRDQKRSQTPPFGCKNWDQKKQKCIECVNGWLIDSDGFCAIIIIPNSDICKSFDSFGICTECYKNYDLIGGKCVIQASNYHETPDLGCKTWNQSNNKCIECNDNWFLSQKGCTLVSYLCKYYDSLGACTQCYQNYDLIKGQCILTGSNNPLATKLGCRIQDYITKNCLECSRNWFFTIKNVCAPVSYLCKSHDLQGGCTSCYQDYDLIQGQCYFSAGNNSQQAPIGCKIWNKKKNKCLKCEQNWTMNQKGICVQNAKVTPFGCKIWDQKKQKCTECVDGWIMDQKGACFMVVLNGQNPQSIYLGCRIWDSTFKQCISCQTNFFFNQKFICSPIPQNCKKYDPSGMCTQCQVGYQFLNGKCKIFNPLCKSVNNDSGCDKCYPGYVLYQSNCILPSKLATIVLSQNQSFESKLEKILSGNSN